MGTALNINLDDDRHEWLSEVKDEHGLTWEGMLVQAGKRLESD